MSVVPQPKDEVTEQARRLYDEFVAPTLTEADREKYITINRETGEFEMDADFEVVLQRAVARFGYGDHLFTVKVGFRPTTSIRLRPFKPEEEEWFRELSARIAKSSSR